MTLLLTVCECSLLVVLFLPCSLGALVSLERLSNYSNLLSILNCLFCVGMAHKKPLNGAYNIKGRGVERRPSDLVRRRQSGLSASAATPRTPPWLFILNIHLGPWISSLRMLSLSPIPVTLDLGWSPNPQFPSTPKVLVAPVAALSRRWLYHPCLGELTLASKRWRRWVCPLDVFFFSVLMIEMLK